MHRILFIFALFVSLNAWALGPIPNGTYTGTETCNGTAYPQTLTFTDTTLKWADQLNAFDFGPDANGFFTLRSISGLSGRGLGHFTEHGLHYEAVFDFPGQDGSTHPSPGEDTLTYARGVIHLDASASAGPKGKFVCTGDFSLVAKVAK